MYVRELIFLKDINFQIATIVVQNCISGYSVRDLSSQVEGVDWTPPPHPFFHIVLLTVWSLQKKGLGYTTTAEEMRNFEQARASCKRVNNAR